MPDLQGNHLFLQGIGPHGDHALPKIAVVATTLIYSFEGPFSICAHIDAKSVLPDNKVAIQTADCDCMSLRVPEVCLLSVAMVPA